MAFPGTLNHLPDEIQSTLDLIAEFDQCFLTGFANLETKQQESLNSWQKIFIGTPLEKPINDACQGITTNEFQEKYFTALAAARVALQGAIYDGLQNQICGVLGRLQNSEIQLEVDSVSTPAHIPIYQESIRQCLMEVALVGFNRLDKSTLVPFISTLEQIQSEPLLIRQAALLTGYMNELMYQVPVTDSNTIPLFRWVDLWSQGMMGGLRKVVHPTPKIISGDFMGLGMDIKSHANFVSWTIYGLLMGDCITQVAKINQSAYKVDAISHQDIWLLFPQAKPILEAFGNQQILKLENIPLSPTGDLIWKGEGVLGDKYKLMEVAKEYFQVQSATEEAKISSFYLTPDSRHPIHIGEPVYLSNYQINQQEGEIILDWEDSGSLKIDCDRMGSFSDITADNLLASSEIFGLMRFDNCCWSVQPLAVNVNKKVIYTGQNVAKFIQGKPKTNTVEILQERASRLLRKSK
ncbi:hypothetical protein [Calothrix sp. NIES-3974]|uniref:hypothetical protein n=1 Tax=Calothrix sp. NIES-3974 TaxID=2005462 RepID=UPI000B6211AF|nr:hypothetical protein [Calothrix sp. NIES-3974]BAZ04698.1 hypothetical protein NIES3974_13410 [Calothrix sp. NIES-3974]